VLLVVPFFVRFLPCYAMCVLRMNVSLEKEIEIENLLGRKLSREPLPSWYIVVPHIPTSAQPPSNELPFDPLVSLVISPFPTPVCLIVAVPRSRLHSWLLQLRESQFCSFQFALFSFWLHVE
jgi:hypothetical protein